MSDWQAAIAADIARLQSSAVRSGEAVQISLNSILRLIGRQAERIQVLEDAIRRDPAGAKNFVDATAERASLLIPRTQLPKPAAKPEAMPEPKSPEEIPAYVARLRAIVKTLAAGATREPDAAAADRLRELASKVEIKASLWEGKLDLDQIEGQADNPRDKLSPVAGAFLDEKGRRYPWQVKVGDKWEPDYDLLVAAEKRATAEKEPAIVQKARELLSKHFPQKPKDVEGKPFAAPLKKRRRFI